MKFPGCFSAFFNFFEKKDAEMFARSEKVATFASAFEKNEAFCEIGIFEKSEVLEKIFAGLKKIVYLCSPFALQNACFFSGSLNYWLYLRERM